MRSYKAALSQVKTHYYSVLICPLVPPHPSGSHDLGYKFLDFFQEKVDSIHRQLLAPVHRLQDFTPPVAHLPQCSLSSLDSSQVTKWISQAKASTCTLDPMHTALVKACLPGLCLLVDIINSSLESGVVPCLSDSHPLEARSGPSCCQILTDLQPSFPQQTFGKSSGHPTPSTYVQP